MKTKKRLGKVYLNIEYVVDLDNESMVDHAKDAVYEDFMSAYKFDEIHHWIKVKEDKRLKEDDIPEFLLEETKD